MPHEILFSLIEETQNTEKMENRKKGNLKKSKTNRVSCFDLYIVVFAILEYFSFALSDCYDFYEMIWSFQE